MLALCADIFACVKLDATINIQKHVNNKTQNCNAENCSEIVGNKTEPSATNAAVVRMSRECAQHRTVLLQQSNCLHCKNRWVQFIEKLKY